MAKPAGKTEITTSEHGFLVGTIEGLLRREGFVVEALRDSGNKVTGDLLITSSDGDKFVIHVCSLYEAAGSGYVEVMEEPPKPASPPRKCERCSAPTRNLYPVQENHGSGTRIVGVCQACALIGSNNYPYARYPPREYSYKKSRFDVFGNRQ